MAGLYGVQVMLYVCHFCPVTDFSRNRFDRFPEELCQSFTSLSKLNFYHNCLRNVPEDIRLLTNLKELNLRWGKREKGGGWGEEREEGRGKRG